MLSTGFTRAVFTAAVTVGALTVAPAAQAAPPDPACEARFLPLPADAEGGEVVGTDGRGTYVGDAFLRTDGSHGVLWRRDGDAEIDLGPGFLAVDVNHSGVVWAVSSFVDGLFGFRPRVRAGG